MCKWVIEDDGLTLTLALIARGKEYSFTPSPIHSFTSLHLHPLHVTPPPVWLEECLLSVLQAQIAVA